jgi:hypothetical protein
MTCEDLNSPVAAAATAQVKLCPYDEEEPHIWFRLIKVQFAAAGIKLLKLKYANALASLSKQVLDVCNDSDEPFNFLKNTLLGQFGKSKWQSYFELLRLPMEMQGLKPSVLKGKLKQHLPPGVSPGNDLFLAMFLIRLPPSMRETVGAGAHKTATDMVKAADALGNARGGHDPTVAAAWTQQSRRPAPSSRKRGDKRDSNARPQAVLPQPSASHFQIRSSLHFPLLQRCHEAVPEPFSYPATRFLHARDWQRLHSLHRCGTRLVNRHHPRGWTSDLFSSQPRPELGGSPVKSWLHPW